MSLPRAHILPDRIPVSDETVDAFTERFRAAAREQDLTMRQTCRYEAWALAFLAWCREESTRRVRAKEIDAFRKALRNRAGLGEETISEAMDALAFLFGAAREARDYIASSGRNEEEKDTEAHAQEPLPEKDILSLQTRWENGAADSKDDPSSSTSSSSQSTASSPSEDASRTEQADQGSASTAEHCIQRFQTQLNAVHSPRSETE